MLTTRHTKELQQYSTAASNSLAVDYASISVDLSNANNIYTAALKVYANINSVSLVDYM
jgi:flagellin-like hook-associated protein FlgL